MECLSSSGSISPLESTALGIQVCDWNSEVVRHAVETQVVLSRELIDLEEDRHSMAPLLPGSEPAGLLSLGLPEGKSVSGQPKHNY